MTTCQVERRVTEPFERNLGLLLAGAGRPSQQHQSLGIRWLIVNRTGPAQQLAHERRATDTIAPHLIDTSDLLQRKPNRDGRRAGIFTYTP
jgi:hypothetical protein